MDTNTQQKSVSSNSGIYDQSSTSSEDIAPPPKRQNKKRTPPTNSTVPQRKSTRNRQSALHTAIGNPVPINTITDKNHVEKNTVQFEIDSPPEKQNTDNYPSLKSLIEEMGFSKKNPTVQSLREIY